MDIISCLPHLPRIVHLASVGHPLLRHYFPFKVSPLKPRYLSGVVVLDPPLAFRVHEARAAAVALGAAAAADAASLVSAQGAAETEQNGRDEEACKRRPREAHQVAANGRLKACRPKRVAAFDDPSAVEVLSVRDDYWRNGLGRRRTS